ncbi:MAG: ERCC4 domain-containing protein [Candidatus Aenigmatarchaeota archaeon]
MMAETADSAEPQANGSNGKVSIIADHRERASGTCEWLRAFNAQVIEKQLAVADYIVSEQVGIERKTVEDFLGSIVSQRLFRQLEDLSSTFEKPLMIIEGDQHALFSCRDMHPNAIHGALSAIALDYRIPIIWTSTPRVTAAQIYWTGYREQVKKNNGVSTRACKKGRDTAQLQEFIVCGLPGINTLLSRRLLSHFGSPREVFWASEKELTAVPGVGSKKAREIHCLLNGRYFAEGKAAGNAVEKAE